MIIIGYSLFIVTGCKRGHNVFFRDFIQFAHYFVFINAALSMFTSCMEKLNFFLMIFSDVRLLQLCAAVKIQDYFQHQPLFIHQVIVFLICFKKTLIEKGRPSQPSEVFDGVLRCRPYIILVSWIEKKPLPGLKMTSIMTESLAGFMTSNQRSHKGALLLLQLCL